MARHKRRKNFGSPAREHLREAARAGMVYRMEKRVLAKHLRAGECRAAMRGLVMTGAAFGRMRGHKEGLSARRQDKGTSWLDPKVPLSGGAKYRRGNAPAKELLDVADRVARVCGLN